MILWFLRLFPQFRFLEERVVNHALYVAELSDLEEKIAELTKENAQLEQRILDVEEERRTVWKELSKAYESERMAHKTHQNIEAQRQFGVILHPDAPHLPPESIRPSAPGPVPSQFVHGRALVSAERLKFAQETLAKRAAAKAKQQ